jgi:hypothetical protein
MTMAEEEKREKSARELQIEARQQRMRELMPQVPRVRVTPTKDNIRKYIKHPSGGGFRSQGPTEWPLDDFTQRRIADGDVTVEEIPQQEQRQPRTERPRS